MLSSLLAAMLFENENLLKNPSLDNVGMKFYSPNFHKLVPDNLE